MYLPVTIAEADDRCDPSEGNPMINKRKPVGPISLDVEIVADLDVPSVDTSAIKGGASRTRIAKTEDGGGADMRAAC